MNKHRKHISQPSECCVRTITSAFCVINATISRSEHPPGRSPDIPGHYPRHPLDIPPTFPRLSPEHSRRTFSHTLPRHSSRRSAGLFHTFMGTFPRQSPGHHLDIPYILPRHSPGHSARHSPEHSPRHPRTFARKPLDIPQDIPLDTLGHSPRRC